MRNRLSSILWGIFFLAIGIGYAGEVMDFWDFHLFFKGWWTLFIIVPCLISIIQSGFGTGSTVGFIIGVLLLINSRADLGFNVWKLVLPVILIYIGIRIIFQGAFHRRVYIDPEDPSGDAVGQDYSDTRTGTHYFRSSRQEYTAIFSSNRVNISDRFGCANASAVFGALVLDLREAVIDGDCEINAQAIFGGIDIYLPQNVKVKVNNIPIFGGISNKHRQPADPAAPVIHLNSTCMFGGIDINE